MANNYLRGGAFIERQRALNPDYSPPTVPTVTAPPTGGNQPPIPGGGTWIQPPPPITAPPTGGNQQPETGPVVYTQPGFISTPPAGVTDGGLTVPPTGGNQRPAGTIPPMAPPLPPIPGINVPPTGGNQPPLPGVNPPPTGGNQPPVPASPQVPLQGGFSPANVALDTMNQIIDPNGAYMRNAYRRGLEAAARGGNRAGSSIAAGAGQRAALEAAMPLVGEALGLQRQREGFAFQGEQAQLDRNQDYTRAQLDDWVRSRAYSRDFYGALSMMPINSAFQLQSMLQQYALENPEVYTSNVISGMSNFFTQNMGQILSTYFPQIYGQRSAGGGG